MQVAVLIPIHPPKYNGFKDMLLACVAQAIPLYLVFSNDSDRVKFDAFAHSCGANTSAYTSILATDKCVCPVVYKRLFGLQHLVETTEYKYILAIDADVAPIPEFFTPTNLLEACELFFANKKAWGGTPTPGFFTQIWQQTLSVFSAEDQQRLLALPRTYTWFSDPPIWERETLKLFLQQVTVQRAATFDFYKCFDNMQYMWYLVLHHGFQFCDSGIQNGIELVPHFKTVENLVETQGYVCNWIQYRHSHEFAKSTNGKLKPFLFYHTDR